MGLLTVLTVMAVALPWFAQGCRLDWEEPGRSVLLASMPGVFLVLVIILAGWWPLSERAEWFFGGDHVRHLVYVAQLRVDGVMDYSTNAYPRAWHSLIALVWSSSGQPSGPPNVHGVIQLISLMSTGVWLLHALLTLTVGQLGAALGRRAGLAAKPAGMAGLIAGCITLWPSFLSNYQILGFENSIVAAVLLSVSARELLERPSSLQALATTAAVAAVMAHVWQLLLPVAALGFALSALAVARRNPGHTIWVSFVGLVTVAVAWPGISAVVTRVGLGSAVNGSVPSPLPLVVLPLSFLSLAILAFKFRTDRRVLGFAGLVGAAAGGALAVAAMIGTPVTQYYPSKMLWTAAVLCLAPLGVVAQQLAQALWSGSGRSFEPGRPVLLVAGALLGAFSLAGPLFPVFGPSATADGPTTLGSLRAPDASSADVVWLPRGTAEETRFDSTTVRLMLEVFEARRGMAVRDQRSPTLAQECEILGRSPRPTVLSTASVEVVRRRYSCVSGVGLIPVSLFVG